MSEVLDLLVIGSGACGLAGAIAAHDAGLTVAIVEKRDRPGGNSALSTGSIPGAGSRYQAAAGIKDSPEQMIADQLAVAGHHDADDLEHMGAARRKERRRKSPLMIKGRLRTGGPRAGFRRP